MAAGLRKALSASSLERLSQRQLAGNSAKLKRELACVFDMPVEDAALRAVVPCVEQIAAACSYGDGFRCAGRALDPLEEVELALVAITGMADPYKVLTTLAAAALRPKMIACERGKSASA